MIIHHRPLISFWIRFLIQLSSFTHHHDHDHVQAEAPTPKYTATQEAWENHFFSFKGSYYIKLIVRQQNLTWLSNFIKGKQAPALRPQEISRKWSAQRLVVIETAKTYQLKIAKELIVHLFISSESWIKWLYQNLLWLNSKAFSFSFIWIHINQSD